MTDAAVDAVEALLSWLEIDVTAWEAAAQPMAISGGKTSSKASGSTLDRTTEVSPAPRSKVTRRDAQMPPRPQGTPHDRPGWDANLHELRMGARVVKRFKRPAESQELILTAFEEEGWPDVIDDPLPVEPGHDPKRRLHYTVHHLNRGQRPFLIQFHVNGNGESVYWCSARDRRVSGARSARKRR
jgi:hypothetical protein